MRLSYILYIGVHTLYQYDRPGGDVHMHIKQCNQTVPLHTYSFVTQARARLKRRTHVRNIITTSTRIVIMIDHHHHQHHHRHRHNLPSTPTGPFPKCKMCCLYKVCALGCVYNEWFKRVGDTTPHNNTLNAMFASIHDTFVGHPCANANRMQNSEIQNTLCFT